MSSEIKTHKDLDVWKRAISLVEDIYRATKSFPKDELYGLTNQIRRTAVSIPSNIAEGSARNSTNEFIRFLNIALGSVAELETQIIISERLGYFNDAKIIDNLSIIRKELIGLLKSMKRFKTL